MTAAVRLAVVTGLGFAVIGCSAISDKSAAAQAPVAEAEEIRGFLGEVRPLAAACSGSVTIRSLVMYGSGAEARMMRLPPAAKPCAALVAEIQLWESRLAAVEAGS